MSTFGCCRGLLWNTFVACLLSAYGKTEGLFFSPKFLPNTNTDALFAAYQEIVTIPRGAMHVKITESAFSSNYLGIPSCVCSSSTVQGCPR